MTTMRRLFLGPIWSEGNAAFFWAGYLDTDYAQCNQADDLPLVDFKLRKMNPLENLNGYDLSKAGDRPLLLGGGVGVPPLYLLAKRLRAEGKQVSAVLGFNNIISAAPEIYDYKISYG